MFTGTINRRTCIEHKNFKLDTENDMYSTKGKLKHQPMTLSYRRCPGNIAYVELAVSR